MERNPTFQKKWMSKLFSACGNSLFMNFKSFGCYPKLTYIPNQFIFIPQYRRYITKQKHVLGVWRTFTFKTVYETSNITIKICILTLYEESLVFIKDLNIPAILQTKLFTPLHLMSYNKTLLHQQLNETHV